MCLILYNSLHEEHIVLGFPGVDLSEGIAGSTDSSGGQDKSKTVIDASSPKKDELACGFGRRGCLGRGGGFDPALGALAF